MKNKSPERKQGFNAAKKEGEVGFQPAPLAKPEVPTAQVGNVVRPQHDKGHVTGRGMEDTSGWCVLPKVPWYTRHTSKKKYVCSCGKTYRLYIAHDKWGIFPLFLEYRFQRYLMSWEPYLTAEELRVQSDERHKDCTCHAAERWQKIQDKIDAESKLADETGHVDCACHRQERLRKQRAQELGLE